MREAGLLAGRGRLQAELYCPDAIALAVDGWVGQIVVRHDRSCAHVGEAEDVVPYGRCCDTARPVLLLHGFSQTVAPPCGKTFAFGSSKVIGCARLGGSKRWPF